MDGKRGDRLLIDDPHLSEAEMMRATEEFLDGGYPRHAVIGHVGGAMALASMAAALLGGGLVVHPGPEDDLRDLDLFGRRHPLDDMTLAMAQMGANRYRSAYATPPRADVVHVDTPKPLSRRARRRLRGKGGL